MGTFFQDPGVLVPQQDLRDGLFEWPSELHSGTGLFRDIAVEVAVEQDQIIATRQRRTRFVADGTVPHGARIESVGAYAPPTRVSSDEVAGLCTRCTGLDIEGVTGIRERRVCAGGEDSLSLAFEAAKDCLAHSRYGAEDLDMIVFCGITKYDDGLQSMRFQPAMSLLLRERLGARSAVTIDVANACAGMMTGVHVVNDFVRRGAIRRGLVVSGEYITHLGVNASKNIDHPRHLETASLSLGDAGAAVLLDRTDADAGIRISAFATHSQYVELCNGGPCEAERGGRMLTHAHEIHQAGIIESVRMVSRVLGEAGVSYGDIDYVISHQTAARAIQRGSEALAMACGQGNPKWIINLERYGNTASTTHFLALRESLEQQRFRKGDRILLLSQASGLALGVVLFTMDSLSENYARTN